MLGVAGCPSCGVERTSSVYRGGRVGEAQHERISGRGIFMEEMERGGTAFRAEEMDGLIES